MVLLGKNSPVNVKPSKTRIRKINTYKVNCEYKEVTGYENNRFCALSVCKSITLYEKDFHFRNETDSRYSFQIFYIPLRSR